MQNIMTHSEQQQRLIQMSQSLRKAGLAAMIVPRSDEFLGEYVPPSAERLKWITGFSGSWGTALIGQKTAGLIIDGRYTIQAARETAGLKIDLLTPEQKSLEHFLQKNFKPKDKIAHDPWLSSISEVKRLEQLAEKLGLTLVPLKTNLIDALWQDRPAPPRNPVIPHPQKFAGTACEDKLKVIVEALHTTKTDAVVLADPLSVAWAFNIRGSDVQYTPIALMRALITRSGRAILFVDKDRLEPAVLQSFGKTITTKPPAALEVELRALGKAKKSVALDPTNCPEAIRVILQKSGAKIIEASDPCILPRARKNITEQKGARAAHLRDGVAMCHFLHWLEQQKPDGTLTETSAKQHLLKCREATGHLLDLSFGTISASGPNAAQPHYQIKTGQGRKLRDGEIYLIDSGGQYRDGTTDITRTTIFGTPTAQMQKHFTLVLKGMIAVSLAKFPQGTTGVQLDAFARQALWHHGHDFDHGTGHGVGSYLSVHEGPARISKAGHVAIEPGMILSNEPGYYLKGKYGIRIENLLLVKPAAKPKSADRAMLSFETLTFAPIDNRLIDASLLTRSELQWLDAYHQEVLKKLGQLVARETQAWLAKACAPLT
jgi:Xaa-Pro aminopeptidase